VGSVLTDFDEEYIIYKFDIVAFDSITNEALKEHINRVGKIIYEKNIDK